MQLSNKAKQILSETGWLSRQPENVRNAFLDMGEIREWQKGQTIFNIGDPKGSMIGIVSGWVNTIIAPLAMDPMLMHVSGPGAWGGETAILAASDRRAIVSARTSCRIAHFPEKEIQALARTVPELRTSLAALSAGHMDHLLAVVLSFGQKNPDTRVRLALLRLVGDGLMFGWNDNSDPKDIPVTQRELAEMSMLSRNAVGAVLKDLEDSGALEIGYKKLTILNRELLRPKT